MQQVPSRRTVNRWGVIGFLLESIDSAIAERCRIKAQSTHKLFVHTCVMTSLYRGSNGCYYTPEQICNNYETGAWEYVESKSEPGVAVVKTSGDHTVTLLPAAAESFPFHMPGDEAIN